MDRARKDPKHTENSNLPNIVLRGFRNMAPIRAKETDLVLDASIADPQPL